MKKIAILIIILFYIGLISGCFEPPPGGVIEPDIENLDIICDISEKYNDLGDKIIEWIISGTVTNNDDRTAEWILIRGYFYDETGKYLQYHESYNYEEYLSPGESFNFIINWYWGDTEGDLIADIDKLPQNVTFDYAIINAEYSIE